MASCTPDIDIERDYTIIGLISSGAFGKVVKVRVNRDFTNGRYNFKKGMELAMKIDQHSGGVGGVDYRSGGIGEIIEIDILNRVNHPNVVNAYDTFSRSVDGQCINIKLVIPLATYNLTTYIKKHTFDPNVTLDIMYQLLCGLYYLHHNYIIHDDLKPDNILVYEDENTGKLVVKITDFGISGIVTKPEGIKKVSQTIFWRPYEILRKNIDGKDSVLHSYEADIWSMGVIFHQLITGINPFDPEDTKKSPIGSPRSPLEPDYYEEERSMVGLMEKFARDASWKSDPKFQGQMMGSADLIGRMLDLIPKTRASAGDLLNDPIFDMKSCLPKRIKTIGCGTESYLFNKYPKSRRILFDWMKDVRTKFKLDYGVLFLAYDIVDRYFAALTHLGPQYHIEKNRFQLVSIVAMYLAGHLVDITVPYIDDYLWITARSYNLKEFMNMLCDVLEKLDWAVFRPTLYVKHPELDPVKLVQCYMETTTPTLEMCQ